MSSEILLIGLGDFGCNILSKISIKPKLRKIGVRSITFDPEKTHVYLRYQIEEPIIEEKDFRQKNLEEFLRNSEIVFLFCGLGGKTGTIATKLIADIAIKYATVVCLAVIPFKFEKRRYSIALEWLGIIKDACDTLILVENDLIAKNYPDLLIDTAFECFDEIITSTLIAIIDAVALNCVNEPKRFKEVLKSGGISTMLYSEGKSCSEAISGCLSNPLYSFDVSSAKSLFLHVEAESKDEAENAVNLLKDKYETFLSFKENVGAKVFGLAFGIA